MATKKYNLYRIYSEKEIKNLNQKYINCRNLSYLDILDLYMEKYDIKFTNLIQNFQISKTILTKLKNGEDWWFGQIPELKFIFDFSIIFINDVQEFNEIIINTFDLLQLANTCNFNKQEYIIKNISLIYSMLKYELNYNELQDLRNYKTAKEFLKARYINRIDYISQIKDDMLK